MSVIRFDASLVPITVKTHLFPTLHHDWPRRATAHSRIFQTKFRFPTGAVTRFLRHQELFPHGLVIREEHVVRGLFDGEEPDQCRSFSASGRNHARVPGGHDGSERGWRRYHFPFAEFGWTSDWRNDFKDAGGPHPPLGLVDLARRCHRWRTKRQPLRWTNQGNVLVCGSAWVRLE